MLHVVMTPSSVRLAEPRLCLWWGRIMDQGMRCDTSSWSRWATTVSVSALVRPTGAGGQVPMKDNGVFTTGASPGYHYGLPGRMRESTYIRVLLLLLLVGWD
jgi:hypothetical protein